LSAGDVPDWKRRATLVARAALAGAVLIETVDDAGSPTWVLTQDERTSQFASLDDVERAVAGPGTLA
jgi:hypothetical protein